MQGWKKGFTIVELIIVIVVIALLALIVLVSYNRMRNISHDTTVMADLRNLSGRLKLFESDNNTAPVVADLVALKWTANRNAYNTNGTTVTRNIVYCYSLPTLSDNRYWVVVALSKSGKIFYTTQSEEPKEYTKAIKPTFDDAETTCATLTSQVTGQTYERVYHGWYASDTTTGPWRTWTQQQ